MRTKKVLMNPYWLILAAMFFVFALVKNTQINDTNKSLSWSYVFGLTDSVGIESFGEGGNEQKNVPVVNYHYTVNGKTFSARKTLSLVNGYEKDENTQILQGLRNSSPVKVYYDSTHPDRSTVFLPKPVSPIDYAQVWLLALLGAYILYGAIKWKNPINMKAAIARDYSRI